MPQTFDHPASEAFNKAKTNMTPQQKAAASTEAYNKKTKGALDGRELDYFNENKNAIKPENTDDFGIPFPKPGNSDEKAWDDHNKAVEDAKNRFLNSKSEQDKIDQHITAMAAGRKYDPKVLEHLNSIDGYMNTNLRRADLGMDPVNYPNPSKQTLRPVQRVQEPTQVAGLRVPSPPILDNTVADESKPLIDPTPRKSIFSMDK